MAPKYVARMPLMENVEKKIFKIEGFEVRVHHESGRDIRDDKANVPQYPYKRALKNTKTVAGWRTGRFANRYPGYTVKVYTADGSEAAGNTRLSSLRDTYLDDE
jgi:hypothetical protein